MEKKEIVSQLCYDKSTYRQIALNSYFVTYIFYVLFFFLLEGMSLYYYLRYRQVLPLVVLASAFVALVLCVNFLLERHAASLWSSVSHSETKSALPPATPLPSNTIILKSAFCAHPGRHFCSVLTGRPASPCSPSCAQS